MFKIIIIAFSMFSNIKMPQFVWKNSDMKYLLVAFPFVGIAVSIFMVAGVFLFEILNFSKLFIAFFCTISPIFITGGIHLDGFIDTCDALSSNLSVEKKIEILGDPHVGAFGIIFTICYFFISFATYFELEFEKNVIFFLFIIFFASRCISSLTLLKFKKAKKNGLGMKFSEIEEKKNIEVILMAFLLILSILSVLIDVKYAIFTIFSSCSMVFYWKKNIVEKFGGTTGDLQGFLLQILEISMIFSLVLAQKVV